MFASDICSLIRFDLIELTGRSGLANLELLLSCGLVQIGPERIKTFETFVVMLRAFVALSIGLISVSMLADGINAKATANSNAASPAFNIRPMSIFTGHCNASIPRGATIWKPAPATVDIFFPKVVSLHYNCISDSSLQPLYLINRLFICLGVQFHQALRLYYSSNTIKHLHRI